MTIPLSLSSVPDVAPSAQYVATPGQTAFPYPFPITQDADLVVALNGVSQPTDFGYSLTGQGSANGGTVNFAVGQPGGTIVTVFRNIIIERLTQIAQNSGFSSVTFNAEFNNIYLILQQLQQQLGLALQLPNTNHPAPVTTLAPENYANSYLYFDANGNPTPAAAIVPVTLTEALIDSLLTVTTTEVLSPLAASTKRTDAEIAAGITILAANQDFKPGDIRRYGAVGDGVTDNTLAISSAIAQAKQTGGAAIYVPSGSFVGSWLISGIFTGIKIYGDGMQLSELVGVDSSTDVITFAAGASIWGLSIDGVNIYGGLNGLHFPTGLAFPPFLCSITNSQIQSSAGRGIYDQAGVFTFKARQVFITNTTDNAFDILGGNTVLLDQCYAAVVPTGTGKAGYRIHGGQPLMTGCNGVNAGDYWGVFGDTVAEDGILRYCSPILDRCNVESFTICGTRNKNGGITVRNGTQYVSHLANNIAVQINPTNKSQRGFLENDSCFVNTAGGWLNTYPVHVTDNSAIPFSAVFSPNANDTFTYYDENASANATVSTITPLTVVTGALGYGIHDLYTKGVLRHGSGGSLGVFGATPVVQPTTAGGAAAFVAGAGTAVNDASTFGGYTLKQVVKALQNLGILA